MAKATKPSFEHSTPAVQVSPRTVRNSQKGKRKKVAMRDKNMAMTPARWKNIIAAIAHGHTRAEAARMGGLTVQSIDAYLISNVAAYKQLRDAIHAWNRRDWPSQMIDDIFNDLALGATLKAAAMKQGVRAERMTSLYMLVRHDKQIREAYDTARELQAESFLDEIVDIADDSGQDRKETGAINHEVVNRSKLRIETRRFAMGAMVKKRFGDTKHVEIEGNIAMNHIAMLTGARKRLEKIRPGAVEKTAPVIIENETGELAELGEA